MKRNYIIKNKLGLTYETPGQDEPMYSYIVQAFRLAENGAEKECLVAFCRAFDFPSFIEQEID